MIINNNMSAMNAHRQLGINQNFQQSSMEKLSSGLRINRAGDDAAGLSISEKMRAQIRGLDQASRNSQDGISLIQTAEGALDESHSILQRMRELVVQAGNTGTNEEADLQAIQDEIGQLQEELTGIANRTEFNGKTLLNGDFEDGEDGLVFQIGANATQQISVNIENMDAASLGTDDTLNIASINVTEFVNNAADEAGGFDETLAIVDAALQQVSDQRSALGSVQNRLEHTIRNLDNSSENLQAAESRIRDVDMAKEMMEFTKNNILSQASQSMLAQANQLPQSVLQLLG
ncbi:flagellin Hag [Salipaludibacillus agaradhaerens]|uniref:flagellin Hag n=1 Tax=Salipaludibacillus agaradhaerens TaxID=76935 RepID=UPI002151E039|nr:flagellin Hag [Salipaludibacillus agaradhaerens]MCR6108026.1 flagellin Hag [Salipaludibacillus agaradhaerens]MCR6120052.1 flagellin Hag [Salipaludibacillus agaradhaerens]UJW59103.1 flagellin Hag [Bacillus sp. A116_S68]